MATINAVPRTRSPSHPAGAARNVACEDAPVSERLVQVRRLRDRDAWDRHLAALGVTLPHADDLGGLGEPFGFGDRRVGNRFAALPMEGWDGTADGRPTDLVQRRWGRIGASGAKLVWGGEAVAVTNDGRANPRQLAIGPHALDDLAALRDTLVGAHREQCAATDDLVVGLQLTHSGRWSRPGGAPAPRVAYRHPFLDARAGVGDGHVVTDAWLDDLVGAFVVGARVAQEAGFDFVDIKHCHGYLLHELLSAHQRSGRYGGDLGARLRFLEEVVRGIARDAPGVRVAVRLSAFDVVPHVAGAGGRGVPVSDEPYAFAFGGDGTGVGVDLADVHRALERFATLGVVAVCVTAGSPYYSPHVQRPAYFPPSDGYRPPRDPLHEVARLVAVTAELARAHPDLVVVASGLSYLQEWLPAVAAGLVADGGAHAVGYGRGLLSYPALPLDVLAGRPLAREQVCRSFSDCTTAPRNGIVSGCYPLDAFYKERPERDELARAKRGTAR
jgi:2,4-dienoyl-CoA reductase-like NADH-dependent reductase (Old Yellow Enzyme family)